MIHIKQRIVIIYILDKMFSPQIERNENIAFTNIHEGSVSFQELLSQYLQPIC